jgi:RimJ/RimL family protein N-acetyltransferase
MACWSRRLRALGRWQRLLDEGVYTSDSEIGDAENISNCYVSRILRLASLAPDIIEGHPRGMWGQSLMLEMLERLRARWEGQRAKDLRRVRATYRPPDRRTCRIGNT